MTNKEYKAVIEAILFTMGESVELEKIADTIELDKNKTKKLIEEMIKEKEDQLDIIQADCENEKTVTQLAYNQDLEKLNELNEKETI